MSARRQLAPLGVAVGGVLTGHWLTYVIVSPHPQTRAAMLRATGHAYLGFANDLAVVIALTTLATMFIGQLASEPGVLAPAGIARRIVAFQVSAFVLMEVLERVTAGAPLDDLIRTGVLPVGIAVQAGLGILAALAIRWLLYVADRVAAALAQAAAPTRRPVVAFPLAFRVDVPIRRHLSAAGVRGPPSSV